MTFHSRGVQVSSNSWSIHKWNFKNFTEISPDQLQPGTQHTNKICIETYENFHKLAEIREKYTWKGCFFHQ